MKTSLSVCAVAAVLSVGAADAFADPIVMNTSVTTSGVFSCRREPACTASGNTVTLGTGVEAVTLSFTGISTTIGITNMAQRVTLGTLTASSVGGATTFPTRTNPLLPIVGFNLTITHNSPIPDSDWMFMLFGPGGRPDLPYQQGGTIWLFTGPFDLGPVTYPWIIYSLSPFMFSVPVNGSVDVTADVGAVPEPATMLLVGFGLLGAGAAARRRK